MLFDLLFVNSVVTFCIDCLYLVGEVVGLFRWLFWLRLLGFNCASTALVFAGSLLVVIVLWVV